MSLPIKAAQVTGAKPAITCECIAVSSGILIIAGHHNRPADQDFADSLFVRLIDFDFNSIERRAHRSDLVVFKSRYRCGSAGFRQAITLENCETQMMKIPRNIFVEAGSSRNRKSESPTKRLVNGFEKPSPGIQPKPITQPAICRKHEAKHHPHGPGTCLHSVPDLFMKQIPESRHANERSCTTLS